MRLLTSALLLLSWYGVCCSGKVLLQPMEVDALLGSQRLLNNMVKCLLDEGPCTRQAKEIKKTLPSALQSACANCDPQQKLATEKLFQSLRDKFPKEWEKLLIKYDPEGVLRKKSQWLAQFS